MGPVADQARGRCQKCALHTPAIPYGQSKTGQAEAAGSQSVVASEQWGRRKLNVEKWPLKGEGRPWTSL